VEGLLVFGVGARMRISGARRSHTRLSVIVVTLVALLAGTVSAVGAKPAQATPTAHAAAPKPADFGTGAEKSADVALDGWGDSTGYHLELGRENSGFAWNEVALLRPAGRDESSWTGYQCLSGDGKFAAVAILPASAVNQQAARDHGAFAYAVDLTSGTVRPLATGVGLKYFSPGCGTGTKAVFTLDVGENDRDTQLVSADLATGKIDGPTTVTGQLTSAVPTDHGIVGVEGSNLVLVTGKAKPAVVAPVTGNAYELRPTTDGGVSFLHTTPGSRTSWAVHAHAGTVITLGSGDVARIHLFQGRAGRAVLTGANTVNTAELAAAGVTRVEDKALSHGAVTSSLDGDALVGRRRWAEGRTGAVGHQDRQTAHRRTPSYQYHGIDRDSGVRRDRQHKFCVRRAGRHTPTARRRRPLCHRQRRPEHRGGRTDPGVRGPPPQRG
jgi:hypothetical protein